MRTNGMPVQSFIPEIKAKNVMYHGALSLELIYKAPNGLNDQIAGLY